MVRFKQADDATIDTSDPIPVPGAGNERSYWKQLYFKVTAGTFTQIDNINIWTDGATTWGAQVTLYIGLQFPTNNSGAPESGYEVADTTNAMTTDHSGVSTEASVFNYTSGSGLTISISESGSVIDATGEMTDYIVMQMNVASGATGGDLDNEDITWEYDEI